MKILNLYAGIGGNRKLWEDFKIWCIKNKTSISEKLAEVIKEVMKDGKWRGKNKRMGTMD